MELSKLVVLKDKWISCLTIENKSPATIRACSADLKAFFSYIEELEIDVADMDITDSREFVRFRTETNGGKVSSTKRLISTLNQFFNWLVKSDELVINPFQDVSLKKQDKNLPHIMSEEEIAILLDSEMPDDSNELDKELWIRDRAIIEIMYSSGLRVSEVSSLEMNNINSSQNLVRVVSGKGSKDRIVPIGNKAIKALNKWYELRSVWGVPENVKFCFVAHNTLKQISSVGIWKRVVKHGERMSQAAANLNYNKLHPHLFRHCFATHLLNASDNLRAIQEMLGHENISTTAIYTQVSTNRLMKEYDKAHPRAHLKGRNK